MHSLSDNSSMVVNFNASEVIPDDLRCKSRLRLAETFLIDDRRGSGTFLDTLIERMGWTASFAMKAIEEYKRFMVLQSWYPDKKLGPSMSVDSVWHLHLLYTVNYQQFCRSVLNVDFIHHDPQTGNAEKEEMNDRIYIQTLIAYTLTFSSPPPDSHWGTSAFTTILS